jgi:hypothetical protein
MNSSKLPSNETGSSPRHCLPEGGISQASSVVIPIPPLCATSTSSIPLSRQQVALSLKRTDLTPQVDHEDRRSEKLRLSQDDDDDDDDDDDGADDDHYLGTFAFISKNDATPHDNDDDVQDYQVMKSTLPKCPRGMSLPTTLMHRSQKQAGASSPLESVYTNSPPLSYLAGMMIPPKIVDDDDMKRRKTKPF